MIKKDDISLEQVRAAMETLARKAGCCVTEIEIRPVQAELGKGSNGTIGAFVKHVKMEYVNSKAYDRTNFSVRLKSALVEEINAFVDNARQNASEGMACLSRDHGELLRMNQESRETIDALSAELEEQQKKTGQEMGKLFDELARSKQKIADQQETEERIKEDAEAYRKDLVEANQRTAELNRQIGRLESDVEAKSSERDNLSAKLNETEKTLASAQTTVALCEQAVKHQKEVYSVLLQTKESLESRIDDLNGKLDSAMAANTKLHDNMEKLRNEHSDELKRLRARPSGDKK